MSEPKLSEKSAREKYATTIALMRKWMAKPDLFLPDKSHEAVVALADENAALEQRVEGLQKYIDEVDPDVLELLEAEDEA